MGEAHDGAGLVALESPQRSLSPAWRSRLSLLLVPPCALPTTAKEAPPRAASEPPDLSLNAPTESDATTCVAPAHSSPGGICDVESPSNRNWPETVVSTASRPELLSSPSSDTAPRGSFA